MAAIVIRAAQIDPINMNIDFSDSSSVSDWAHSALATAGEHDPRRSDYRHSKSIGIK